MPLKLLLLISWNLPADHYRVRKVHTVGTWVTTDLAPSKPFKLDEAHFSGVTRRTEKWFKSLVTWKPKKGEWVVAPYRTALGTNQGIVFKYGDIESNNSKDIVPFTVNVLEELECIS